MIEVYEGRLGGGKTYSAVLRMVEAWADGATVCTNISVNWENCKTYCRRVFGLELDDRQLILLPDDKISEFHKHTPSNCLVVLDEVHLWFNSRDWAQSSRELLAFLTQSRKYKTDIIFISQSALNMDKQFMRLVQFIWRFRDMERFTVPGLYIKWPFKQILQKRFDYDGKTEQESRFVHKSKEIFDLYDTNSVYKTSFQRLELDARGMPKKVKEKKNMKWIYLGVILAAVGLLAVNCGKLRRWGKMDGSTLDLPVAAPTGSPVVRSAGGSAPVPAVEYKRITGSAGGMVCVDGVSGWLSAGDSVDGWQYAGCNGHVTMWVRQGRVYGKRVGDLLK